MRLVIAAASVVLAMCAPTASAPLDPETAATATATQQPPAVDDARPRIRPIDMAAEDPTFLEPFDAPWRQVERVDKTGGWVRGDKVRSPIDYRACFQKTGGEWKMNLLVAGD